MKPLTELKQIAQDATQGYLEWHKYEETFDPPTVLGLLELIRVQHEIIDLIVNKRSSNFSWRAPDYMIDQADAALAAHDAMFRATGEDGGKDE